MNKFQISFEERSNVTIEAETEDEALDKFHEGEYDDKAVEYEGITMVESFEVEED